LLQKIIQNSTVQNPATINGLPYNCVIYGDETVQHFGVDFPAFLPARIYVECNQITSMTIENKYLTQMIEN